MQLSKFIKYTETKFRTENKTAFKIFNRHECDVNRDEDLDVIENCCNYPPGVTLD